MKSEVNVFIYRRDYRIIDNLALNKLVDKYPNTPILHIFIFNPIQIDKSKNAYYNKNCVEFMIQSLKSLRDTLKDSFYFFYDKDTNILQNLLKSFVINAIAWNIDYTPFAKARDDELEKWCTSKNIDYITAQDYTLFEANFIKSGTNKPYEVFTPFYNKCISLYDRISEPYTSPNISNLIYSAKKHNTKLPGLIKNIDQFYDNNPNPHLKVQGGRENALAILEQVKRGTYKNYDITRNFPSVDKTTKLAAYIKFGCVSIREVCQYFRKYCGLHHGLLRELIWREFYAHATWNNPHVLEGKPYKAALTNMRWLSRPEWYICVMEAKTGFPIIDAAIKELKATGWMNNRLRMVVASFIAKDLMMDWRIFERDLFARYLVDYDPSTNCHSWQGMASVGIDSAPYWRIMNPWIQMKKFDKDCVYIKKWLPELSHLTTSQIMGWRTQQPLHNYPEPMVDHEVQVKAYLAKWRK